MVNSNRFEIILVMFFIITLFSTEYAYGMFNEQGQWICSREIDIELSYYESYTDRFQNAIDEVYLENGASDAQSYFKFAVEGEIIGQNWKRSQDCLIRLGIDNARLSPIVIPTEKITDRQIEPSVDDTDNLIPMKEILPKEENFENESTNNSPYVGVGIIIILIIIGIAGFVFFSSKSRKENRNARASSKEYENIDDARDEHYGNIEIEIKGGIEK